MFNYNSWCTIKTKFGLFRLYENDKNNHTCYLLSAGELKSCETLPLVRIHSSCITSEVFKSLDCDCNDQLMLSLEKIQNEKSGLLFYLLQEGRGQGIANKIKGMKLMEDKKIDTIEAYSCLNLQQDVRDYLDVINVLKELNILSIKLLTNNPLKITQIQNAGINVERIELIPKLRPEFVEYLKSKKDKLNHLINL